MPNDLPPLPEPAFRLKWKDGAYYVSRPNIDDTDCYTYAQLRDVQAIARQQGRDEMREWKASRVRDEALEEAAKMCESRAWRSLEGIAADIRSLIGTPKSAEGEGA